MVVVPMVTSGSSPRGRGKLHVRDREPDHQWLIPARAGKTKITSLITCRTSAHPRAGGENERGQSSFVRLIGSSPRGRGKLEILGAERQHGRLIPARAGKTDLPSALFVTLGGSSPRGRGKRQGHRVIRPRLGLIPARAGKTHDN